MIFPVRSVERRLAIYSLLVFSIVTFSPQLAPQVNAQGAATNHLGNGGIHTIQGRIFVSNGRRSDVTGLRIRLLNFSSSDLTVIADGTGAFTFRNLVAGSYVVKIEGGDAFEDVQESVSIDDPGSSALSNTVRLRTGSKIATVQIFLKPRSASSSESTAPNVINAKLATVPKAAADQYAAAQRSIAEKNEANAISQLRSALAIHKDFSLAWNDLGVLLERSGDLKNAVDAFRSAVRYEPASFAANLNLGCALVESKQYEEGVKHLLAALTINGSSFRGHFYMGVAQLSLGRMDIAEQAFLKAIELGGNQSGRAHYLLAGVYWGAKRYKDAADHLEKFLQLEPNAKDAVKARESIAELRKKKTD